MAFKSSDNTKANHQLILFALVIGYVVLHGSPWCTLYNLQNQPFRAGPLLCNSASSLTCTSTVVKLINQQKRIGSHGIFYSVCDAYLLRHDRCQSNAMH
jgi:hypothetical protein